MATLSLAARMALIGPLFEDCPRVPDQVVCANCHLGSEHAGVEHYAPVAEDSVCLWPCRHEVQRGVGECPGVDCVAARPPERRPF